MASDRDKKLGILLALSAFVLWGFFPIYFKAVSHVSPGEVLCHRIIWTAVLSAGLIALRRDWKTLLTALAQKKVLLTLFLTAGLIAVNWFVFIYSVITARILESSLGYFLMPIVNVFLGMVVLRERLRPLQVAAILLAAAGTLNQTVIVGSLPWISLVLCISFSIYGLLRKTVNIEALNGLFVETALISPLALGYLFFLGTRGRMSFGTVNWETTALLFLVGIITTATMVMFTSGARRIEYTTIGLYGYLSPSIYFLLAVFFYHEPFNLSYFVTFVFIWAGLGIFVADWYYVHKKLRRLRPGAGSGRPVG